MDPCEVKTPASHTLEDADEGKSARPSRVCFLIESPSWTGVLTLARGENFTIGRAPPSDVVIDDRCLSRMHARLGVDDAGQCMVDDLGSTNATCVNGIEIQSSKLKTGDQVVAGSVSIAILKMPEDDVRSLGLDSHDQFISDLEEEIARAKLVSRGFAVLMVRPDRGTAAHFSEWCPGIRRMLRPIDKLAWFGAGTAQILAPEITLEVGLTLARALASPKRHPGAQPLLVGIAFFPTSATSAHELIEKVGLALARATPSERVAAIAPESAPIDTSLRSDPIDVSPAMKSLLETIERVASAEAPLLLFGETGSGKDVVARMIHARSERRDKVLFAQNCAAIPRELLESTLFGHEKGAFTGAVEVRRGIFEAAHGGTVFLDEIGELSLAAQAALLRVIETKHLFRLGSSREIEIDVRIIAATHRNLEAMCEEGTFRWDLFHRLNVISLDVPPLRKRREDIPILARQFLTQANQNNRRNVTAILPKAMDALVSYGWPGNVRELKNAIERAVVLARGSMVELADLPAPIQKAEMAVPDAEGIAQEFAGAGLGLRDLMKRVEVKMIVDAIARSNGNLHTAARQLKTPLRTLTHKMRLHGIRRTKIVTAPAKPEPSDGT